MTELDVLGWFGVGLLVLVVGVFLRRRRMKRVEDSTVTPEDNSVAPQRTWAENPLTQREMQIAQMLANGTRNADIAETLNISSYTVQSHIKRIYGKLDVHNRAELVRRIHELSE